MNIFVCPQCGFRTFDVSELHEVLHGGGVIHKHRCRSMNAFANVPEGYNIIWLDDSVGMNRYCRKCYGEGV